MAERIIEITTSKDTETNKTIYVGLTDLGRIFTSYNLKKWKLKSLPNFNVVVAED